MGKSWPLDPTFQPKSHEGMPLKIKLPKRYYTVEQLAERWEYSVEDIKQIIETGDLKTVLRAAAVKNCNGIILSVYEFDADDGTFMLCDYYKRFAAADLEDNVDITVTCEDSLESKKAIQEKLQELKENGDLDPVITVAEVSRFEQQYGEEDQDAIVGSIRPKTDHLVAHDLATSFNGLNSWNFHQWKTNLADPPKWMKPARISCGGPPNPNRWNPVKLARILMSEGKADLNELHNRFIAKQPLKNWLPEWESYADWINED